MVDLGKRLTDLGGACGTGATAGQCRAGADVHLSRPWQLQQHFANSGPRCPRCAMMYEAFAAEAAVNPQFGRVFQIRWILYSSDNPNDLFPLENKPGASINELFADMGSQQTRVVDDPACLERLAGYSSVLHSSLTPFFEGTISGRYTPFIIFKTADGFSYGSMEDFRGDSALEVICAKFVLQSPF